MPGAIGLELPGVVAHTLLVRTRSGRRRADWVVGSPRSGGYHPKRVAMWRGPCGREQRTKRGVAPVVDVPRHLLESERARFPTREKSTLDGRNLDSGKVAKVARGRASSRGRGGGRARPIFLGRCGGEGRFAIERAKLGVGGGNLPAAVTPAATLLLGKHVTA